MRRRPRTDEVLDWEELERAPNTDGAFSFLRPLGVVVDIQDHRPPSPAPPIGPLHITSTVDVMPRGGRSRATRPYKVHRCSLVQDAHSQGENQLYDALWRLGSPDGTETKRITIGWIPMGRRAGMSDKAAKRNLGYLREKLAVDVLRTGDAATRTATTYRVYSFKAILERRRAAGLQCVVKDKGVRFVPCPPRLTLSPTKDDGLPNDKTSIVDITSIVSTDITSIDPRDKTSPETGDKTSIPLDKLFSKKESKTTTTVEELSRVVAALSSYTPADEKAALKMMSESRIVCPVASAAEIVFAIHAKAPDIVRNRSVRNPLGLLISAVPLLFQGEGLRQLRKGLAAEQARTFQAEQERARRTEDEAAWLRRQISRWAEILASPASTEPQKAAAYRELTELAKISDEPEAILALCRPAMEAKRMVEEPQRSVEPLLIR